MTVFDVDFSPDGKILASAAGQHDKTIILWDVTTHKQIGQPLVGHTGSITSLEYSPDGKLLASGGGDGGDRSIILWDATTHEPIGEPLIGHTGGILALAFSPDGKTIASGSSDNTIIIWDISTHQLIAQPLKGHSDIVLSLAFSPDGRKLASGSWDMSILVWDIETLHMAWQLRGHIDSVRGLAFTPDGKTLISGSDDYSVRFWDVEGAPQPFPIIERYYSGTYGNDNLTFIDDKNILASSQGGTIHHFSIDTSKSTVRDLIHSFENKPDLLTGLAFSPDKKLFATGTCSEGTSILCERGEINIWDVDSAKQLGEPLTGKFGWVHAGIFSPDSNFLITGGCGKRGENFVCVQGNISIWDISEQKTIIEFTAHKETVHSLAISPDRRKLASGSDDGTIVFWDLATYQMIGQPIGGHADTIFSLMFSPDGKILASGDNDGVIRLWNTEMQTSIGQPLVQHKNGVTKLAFSPDGKHIASASYDNSIILWDSNTHQPIGQPFLDHTDAVFSLAFSLDGSSLASGGRDRTIILWDVSLQSWIEKACLVTGRNFTQDEWQQYFPDEEYRLTCPQWPEGE